MNSLASRARAVRIASRIALGLVWLYEGLIPKVLFVRPDQIELVQRSGFYFGSPATFLQLLGVTQAGFAIWLLAGYAERLAVAIATIGMAILIVLVAGNNSGMLTDPYGALIKDLCLIACAYTVWALQPHEPHEQHH